MACNFKTTSAGTSIKRKVGANNARFVALVSLISNPETGGFTDEFVKYYQKVNHTDNIPSVDNSERGKYLIAAFTILLTSSAFELVVKSYHEVLSKGFW